MREILWESSDKKSSFCVKADRVVDAIVEYKRKSVYAAGGSVAEELETVERVRKELEKNENLLWYVKNLFTFGELYKAAYYEHGIFDLQTREEFSIR